MTEPTEPTGLNRYREMLKRKPPEQMNREAPQLTATNRGRRYTQYARNNGDDKARAEQRRQHLADVANLTPETFASLEADRKADRERSKAIADRAATLARLNQFDTIDAYGNERRDSH